MSDIHVKYWLPLKKMLINNNMLGVVLQEMFYRWPYIDCWYLTLFYLLILKCVLDYSHYSNFVKCATTSALIGWLISFKFIIYPTTCTNSSIVKGRLEFKGQFPFFCTRGFFTSLYFENSGARVSKASFNYFTRMTLSIVPVS